MEDRIENVLRSIGLNKNEVKIFLDLIKKGPSSALEVSKRTEVHRSNVYDSLRILEEKGFVDERIENKKKLFHAINPEKLKDYALQKEREVESIIGDLKNISSKEDKKSDVSISYGVFAFRNALNDLLKLNSPISVYGIPEGSGDLLGESFLKNFHSERIDRGINMKHIYNRRAFDKISRHRKIKFAEFRHLAKKYDSNTTTMICGDMVVMVIFGDNLAVIVISNEEVAKSYNNYFEILWSHSSDC